MSILDRDNPDIPDFEKLNEPICEMCFLGKEIVEEREKVFIEKYGWLAHLVLDASDCPYNFNYHTHGVKQNMGHTDFQVCAPINPNIAHNIMARIIDQVKKGKTFKAGIEYSGEEIIEGEYSIYFADAEECNRPVLRLIIPDTQNKFIREEMDTNLSHQWEGLK